MANSLKDQLLKAGLTNAKKAKKADHEKKVASKQAEKGQATEASAAELARQAQEAKVERDRELNRQQEEERQRKALGAQIRQLIESNRIDQGKGDVGFQFVDEKKVKKLYVTDLLQGHLSKGLLAIVRLGESYALVPVAVAEKIRQRDESVVVFISEEKVAVPVEDDPYAAYQIPDDLMW